MSRFELCVDGNIGAAYTLPVVRSPAEIFGLNLRSLRERRGLTQEQLADRLGKRQSTISNMEAGISGLPKSITLRDLARVLSCSMEDFFVGVPVDLQPIKRRRPTPQEVRHTEAERAAATSEQFPEATHDRRRRRRG